MAGQAVADSGVKRLVFVVPPDIYPEFAKQGYRTAKKTVWKAKLPLALQTLEQFVLCMPTLPDKLEGA